MTNKAKFFAAVRAARLFGTTLSQDVVDGLNAILDATEGWPTSWKAYALATAFVETGMTMHPIKEYGGPTWYKKMYDIQGSRPDMARAHGNVNPGDGAKYAGRGYVQMTWYVNYAKFAKLLGVDLVGNPDLAMNPGIAAKIMRIGMEQGLFTGASLKTKLPSAIATFAQFKGARPIINGHDRDEDIANVAMTFQKALS